MDSLRPDDLSSFLQGLPPEEPSENARLVIGQQGVYLIRRGEKVSEFQLVPWDKIVAQEQA